MSGKISRTRGESYFIKGIPDGCKYCIKGQKVVLFLNGICQKPDQCSWYCPISQDRKDRDITFADEIEVKSNNDIATEINLTNAKGISITGGEPLSNKNINKTLEYIEFVKNLKGSDFHVHIYTNGVNFNKNIAQKLATTGLDEIRFHPSKTDWKNIKYALNKGIKVGAEVPVIPKQQYLKEILELILFLDEINCDFINLNEFEYCYPNSNNLKDRGFLLKAGTIASVEGSEQSALNLLKEVSNKTSLKIHYCPIILKDLYQLKNRYKRRARNIRKPYEVVTSAGLLVFAQIEGNQNNIRRFIDDFLSNLDVQKNLFSFEGSSLYLPWYIPIYREFLNVMNSYDLECFIIEGIPFRGNLFQITEKTPINLINIIEK